MSVIPNIVLEEIEALKKQGKYDEALSRVNTLLVRDPKNKEALYQVADIEYRRGDITKAEKPVDFLLDSYDEDAMWWYIKGVLEMEKTQWSIAKSYFKKAITMLDGDNPEILRCYGLCEYWSWNREQWITYLMKSYKVNEYDAEVILNLIEISILEKKVSQAKKYIKHFRTHKEKLNCFDRDISYYDEKVTLFEQFLKG